jgi:hypothetical protein
MLAVAKCCLMAILRSEASARCANRALFLFNRLLVRLRIQETACPALGIRNFVPHSLPDQLPLELGKRQQDVERQPGPGPAVSSRNKSSNAILGSCRGTIVRTRVAADHCC